MRFRLSVPVLAAAACCSSFALAQAPQEEGAPEQPLSTAGTALLPPKATEPSAGEGTPKEKSETEANQEARIKALEARVAAAEADDRENSEKLLWLRNFKVSGFVQPQLIWQFFNASASPNVGPAGLPAGIGANSTLAKSDGTSTNPDGFRLRRARLKTEYMPSENARFVLELDPTPTGGPSPGIGTLARNVEAQGIVRPTHDWTQDYGLGIFKVPFSREILESDADRPFIERSYGEQNMFPAEFDTGAKTTAILLKRRLTAQLAVVNGITQGEKTFALIPDLNRSKDVVGRANYNFGPAEVGAGGYAGWGQAVDPVALRFKQIPRFAVNLEGALHHVFFPRVGESRVYGEITVGRNMDRGVRNAFSVPTIPASITTDVQSLDERSFFIRVEQDVSHWVTVAARYDFYSPDTAQKNDARDTYAFVGVFHISKGLQLMAEFDHAIDNIHRPDAAAPSKQIETLSGVLQARF